MLFLRIIRGTTVALLVTTETLLCVPALAAEGSPRPTIVGQERAEAIRAALVGTWAVDIGQVKKTIEFDADGRFKMGNAAGSYAIEGNELRLRSNDIEVAYQFTIADHTLTLSGGDLTQPLEFAKEGRLANPERWLSNWSLPALKARLSRIGAVILIVALLHLVLRLLRTLAHFIIYSEHGPLKFIYRRHKQRTMTVYSLVLNISKYVLYLLAVGLILGQLGIDYTVYLASLSVIGLAIGFGSQGLVQDMVTGFFIVLEEQFNVGDMVEIAPHTGIVEELGLRMTRIRNYLGQRVTIPNRNIAAVGNYTRGAQHVYVDVAITQAADAAVATATLGHVAEQVASQFHDVILSGPDSQGLIPASAGRRFLRLHLAIWPQQQWVIDQELLPRIRETMTREGVEIADDKISVFYHPRDRQVIPRRWRETSPTEGAG